MNKLREATDEALSSFFSTEGDRASQKNSQKKPFLDEIFKIAKLEERYLNGEIGELTDADLFGTWMADGVRTRQTATLRRGS